jgi:hypothetical protein
MQLAISASFVEHRVFPAVRIVARLLLSAPVVLSKVDLFHWSDLFANRHPHVFIRNSAIAISIKPLKQVVDLLWLSVKPPVVHQSPEVIKLYEVVAAAFPLYKGLFYGFKLSEGPCDKPFFDIVFSNYLRHMLLIRGMLFSYFLKV